MTTLRRLIAAAAAICGMVVLASPAGADPENGLIYEGQQCYGYEGQAAYSAIEGYEMLCNDGYPNGSVDPPIWIGNVY